MVLWRFGKICFTNFISVTGTVTGCVSSVPFTCFKIRKSIYKATIKAEFPERGRKLGLFSAILEAISPESVKQSELASEKRTFFFF